MPLILTISSQKHPTMIDDDHAQPLAHGLEDININEASIVGGGHTEDTFHAAVPVHARRRIILHKARQPHWQTHSTRGRGGKAYDRR